MDKHVEHIICWRHNFRGNVGADILRCMKKKGVYDKYLDILSDVDYGIMMDKEYAFVLNDKYLVWIELYNTSLDDINILRCMNLLEESDEVPGYYQLVFDKSKFRTI